MLVFCEVPVGLVGASDYHHHADAMKFKLPVQNLQPLFDPERRKQLFTLATGATLTDEQKNWH